MGNYKGKFFQRKSPSPQNGKRRDGRTFSVRKDILTSQLLSAGYRPNSPKRGERNRLEQGLAKLFTDKRREAIEAKIARRPPGPSNPLLAGS